MCAIGEQRIYVFSKVELYFKNVITPQIRIQNTTTTEGEKEEENVLILHYNKLTKALNEYIFIKLPLTIHKI